MTAERTAVFFGGVIADSPGEERMAEEIGALLAGRGFTLLHGGYNGLMEAAARGAAAKGGRVIAVTLADKHAEWGEFNPHITDAVHLPDPGSRLNHYLGEAELIVAMGGGVGVLHELAAALFTGTALRPVPVFAAGGKALRLLAFLKREKWLVETPTRSLAFIHPVDSTAALAAGLDRLAPTGAGS
ncbi:LOG family protein [Streptomyces sp. PT12]|uniref:SLOG cluster 4 domain-containing protein n=1 Tax=Streptomyces sp. PT12 TaxID=1510197 RepID=UPI000DE3986E|nr:LOG family protein [Streptomyces sp. PT12]RBM05771.1 DNA transporter [Streptomyces sp. PT12]